MSLRSYARNFFARPMVRPWALAGPLLVLLLCLPLLRPLRHPANLSTDESLRLATVQALVENHSLALRDGQLHAAGINGAKTFVARGRVYADQPPLFAVMLSGPAWVMARLGWTMDENSALVSYVLTLLGVTLPVAGAAGLLYRMGRLFELGRPWRAGLAIAIVFASGLVAGAVVLNPRTPAAVLILCSAGCLIHVSLAKLRSRGWSWVFLAGACAALAATFDPTAGIFAVLFLIVIAAIRMPVFYRLFAMLIYGLGVAGPVALHATWQRPITGEIIPGWQVFSQARPLAASQGNASPMSAPPITVADEPDADDVIAPPSRWQIVGASIRWLLETLFGTSGVFSNYPVLLIGVFGIAAVMHRHWPSFVKFLAAASAIAAVFVLGTYFALHFDFRADPSPTKWFTIFMPMLLFWSGAWLRRNHTRVSWVAAGGLLAFSLTIGLISIFDSAPTPATPAAADVLARVISPR